VDWYDRLAVIVRDFFQVEVFHHHGDNDYGKNDSGIIRAAGNLVISLKQEAMHRWKLAVENN
jgi:hypothetical protein